MLGFRLSHFMRFGASRFSKRDRMTLSNLALQHAGQSALAEANSKRESETVEVRGVFVGVAVQHALGYRFLAADQSVLDMTESVWPTLDDLRRAVAQRRRAFLREASWPFPNRRPSQPRTAPTMEDDPLLTDEARLTLDSFDW